MLELNGKKFARNAAEFTASLFDTGGTCAGLYQPHAKSIVLLNPAGERIGVINAHGVLCKATKLDCGRYWYSYGDIPEIGAYASYRQSYEEPRAVLEAHCKRADLAA